MPLFAALPASEIRYLAETLRHSEIPANTILFHEGERGDRFYIVLDGQVEIVQALGTADERLVGVRGPGDYFGEMSLLNRNALRTMSVRARTPVQLLEMARADFDELLYRQPALAYAMACVMSARMQELSDATIRDLHEKNRQLAEANEELKATQAQIIEEEVLRNNEERFRSVAQSTTDAVIVANSWGNVVFWNKGAQQAFGYTEEEILGRPLTVLMPERYHEAHKQGVQRFLTTGEAHAIGKTMELNALRKDGSDFPIELSLSTWYSRENLFFSAILRDITERKRAEQQLKEAFEELKRSQEALEERNRELKDTLDQLAEAQEKLLHAGRMASLGVLVAGVAHEINNPLAAVLQSVNTAIERASKLQPEEISTRICKPLVRSRENAERIQRIVQDLRAFARAERVQGQITDVQNEIETALQMLNEQAERRNVKLVVQYGPVKYIEAPPTRLDQILVNIIQNAIQASPDGATIEVMTGRTEGEDNRAWIKIRDYGSGMSPEVKARIFDPFFTTKPVGEGTGLGLWICQAIVHSLGGSIEVETEPGVGTTFTLLFNMTNEPAK